ncbi:MAG: WYL domain-containing protein [Clostridiales bacterium]|jgi:predicted DNA-binding transcriptional regulator YafY|nr:WYL domain-containing protein [Clostridiales bacterium]
MQHTVIFGILLTIINNGQVTRQQLAQKFEISLRTVARYIQILQAAQIPILCSPGRGGGITIAEDYTLEKGFLTKEEKVRLVTCIKATAPTFNDTLNDQILQKLNEAAKRHSTSYLLKSDTLYIDIKGWGNPQFYRAKISVINQAIAEDKILKLTYCNRYNISDERLFEPYTVVLKDGVWYVYGYCYNKNDYQIFNLSRIESMSKTEQNFTRRADADVSHKLYSEFEETKVNLQIEFSNLRLLDIEQWLGTDSICKSELRYTATAVVSGGTKLISKLMSFGSDIKIISPSYIREELITECQRMVNYNT